MPYQFSSLTPNLIVADIERSLAFYRDVLGFSVEQTVPEAPPCVFVIVRSGPVEVYLNAPAPATEEYPSLRGRPIGGSLTLFVRITGIRAAYESLKTRVPIEMPLEKKWYGVTEFACTDPDGYVITFAEQES
ncbi:MAG TPA: VOC family protein [Vicinamibacterales bacterium]|jgi:catechol 2,3-dioxygenase-like lactoylglutathione lyase family enzyme|nr:VOC family protein [Vicinamibacterales bacterium]